MLQGTRLQPTVAAVHFQMGVTLWEHSRSTAADQGDAPPAADKRAKSCFARALFMDPTCPAFQKRVVAQYRGERDDDTDAP